jgi:hypothetical protein
MNRGIIPAVFEANLGMPITQVWQFIRIRAVPHVNPHIWSLTCYALLIVVASRSVKSQSVSTKNEWPPVRAGIWEESGVRTLPNGKVKKAAGVKIRSCEAPQAIFMSWAGSSNSVIEESGCSYESRRTGEQSWKVITECDIRDVGKSKGTSSVTLRNDSEFETDREFHEGQRIYKLHVQARRIADCPKE